MKANNKRASMLNIAKEVGVSISTVSRALNDHTAISSKVKEQVKDVATRLHYVPNAGAVNLKSGKTNTIGVIVPMISRAFFATAIEGIEDYAHKRGYNVIICQSKNLKQIEEQLVNSLKGKVDGVIASPASENKSHDYFNSLSQINTPLVLFDRSDDRIDASNVRIDDYVGAKSAVEHLIQSGRKKIFHFAGKLNVSIWRDRRRGYYSAMEDAGLEVQDDWVYIGETSKAEGEEYALDIIKNGNIPDAIFFSGDYAALGALITFQKNGIRVPEDIAIVGFANELLCEITSPTISSVDQYSYNMGKISCKILFESIDGGPKQNVVIQPKLIIRESSNAKLKI